MGLNRQDAIAIQSELFDVSIQAAIVAGTSSYSLLVKEQTKGMVAGDAACPSY